MSGGYFNYVQHRIGTDLIEPLERIIMENEEIPYPDTDDSYEQSINEDFFDNGSKRYNDDTIKELKMGLQIFKIAELYATRIDYLLSGDDGEESFHRRLNEDLELLSQTESENI